MNTHDRFSRTVSAARCAAAGLMIALLSTAATANPAQRAFDRGNESFGHGDYPAAIRHFSMALQLDPSMGDAWFLRSLVHNQMGNTAREIADLSECLRIAPNYAEAYGNRGAAYARLGRFSAALADLSFAVGLSPDLAVGWSTRGWVRSLRGEHEEAVADYTRALALDADDLDAHMGRAMSLSALGEYERAVADLDRVLEVYPDDPELLGMRGAAKVARGAITEGIADLAAAIEQNPHDAGANYEPSKKLDLPEEALEHGRGQVRAMVEDRPGLAKYLTPGDALWEWAVRRFAGEALGEPIDWDPTPPVHSEAEHVAPVRGRRGRIRVEPYDDAMPGAPAGEVFEALWSHIVYELHNIGYVPRFEALRRLAADGSLTKREFVEQIFRYEYEAVQQTRAFYVKVYLPWLADEGLTSDPILWFADRWLDVETAFANYTDPQEYPWSPYGRQYDWLRVDGLMGTGNHGEALALLGAMLAEAGYPQDAGRIHYRMGECHLALGQPAAALEAANAAVASDPDEAEAYTLRAEAYEELGEGQKAAADRAQASRLEPAEYEGPEPNSPLPR